MTDEHTTADKRASWRQRVPGPQLPGAVGGGTFLTGVWLVLAPPSWGYGAMSAAATTHWNDVVVGACLMTVGYLRLRGAVRLTPMTVAGLVLGLWLAIAPFALGYDEATSTTLQDIAAGLLVIGLTMTGHLAVTGETERQSNGRHP
ncbi:SPW repeat protein [Actinophytocola sp. NPDC049390]|uniref:SPW repeat domain-containing protein n=1 Tax=Actinophytocola sp. NPDC049390 TaxID=3363894 RepID=UPI0037B37175